MFDSRAARLIVGGLTWLLVAYVVFFVVGIGWMMTSSPSAMDSWFQYIFIAHVAAMLMGMGLLVAYILDVVNNPLIPADKRVLWVVIIFLGSFIGMLVYWFVYFRHPRDVEPVAPQS